MLWGKKEPPALLRAANFCGKWQTELVLMGSQKLWKTGAISFLKRMYCSSKGSQTHWRREAICFFFEGGGKCSPRGERTALLRGSQMLY
jgi:hypothetical protein